MNWEKELGEHSVILAVLNQKYSQEAIYEIAKGVQDRKVCYVTLHRTGDSLINSFRLQGIDVQQFFFLEAKAGRKHDHVVAVSSLAQLQQALRAMMKASSFDLLIVDSISPLPSVLLNTIIENLKEQGLKAILTCREEEVETPVIENAAQHIDKVVKFDSFYKALQVKQRNTAAGAVMAVLLVAAVPFLFSSTGLTGLSIAEQQPGRYLLLPVLLGIVLAGISISVFYRKWHNAAGLHFTIQTKKAHKEAHRKMQKWKQR